MSGTRLSAAERRARAAGENSGGTVGNLRPWKPGQSGNPGGRPKGVASAIREERQRRKISQEDVAAMLFDALDDPRLKPMEKLAIVRELWDREHGKAPTHEAITGGDPLELSAIAAEIQGIADELAARRNGREASSGDASRAEAASG